MFISSVTDQINPLNLNTNNQLKDQNKSSDGSFQNMLNNAVKDVNNQQVEGYKAMEGIATGNVPNLQEAVRQIEEAELSMKLGLEVKNKAIAAFKEIGRMQI